MLRCESVCLRRGDGDVPQGSVPSRRRVVKPNGKVEKVAAQTREIGRGPLRRACEAAGTRRQRATYATTGSHQGHTVATVTRQSRATFATGARQGKHCSATLARPRCEGLGSTMQRAALMTSACPDKQTKSNIASQWSAGCSGLLEGQGMGRNPPFLTSPSRPWAGAHQAAPEGEEAPLVPASSWRTPKKDRGDR